MKIFKLLGLHTALLATMISFLVHAEDSEVDEVPETIKIGIVNSVDRTQRTLVIDDTVYRLALDVEVLGLNGSRETEYALSEGRSVKIELSEHSMRQWIKEIISIQLVPEKRDRN